MDLKWMPLPLPLPFVVVFFQVERPSVSQRACDGRLAVDSGMYRLHAAYRGTGGFPILRHPTGTVDFTYLSCVVMT